MARVVPLVEVWAMLDHCLAGYSARASKHYWMVRFNGRLYASLPLGKHGHRRTAEVEAGHVRSLIKFFGIPEDCYLQHVNPF